MAAESTAAVEHAGEAGHAAGAAGHSPLEQFEVHPLIPIQIGGLDVSFTNAALFMVIAVALIYFLIVAATRHHSMIPDRLQSVVEMAYEFIANLLHENVGREGRRYFPFIFTLFMFILFGNLLGMIPGFFTFTSHIIVTFVMAVFVWVGVTIIGFAIHGAKFFNFFVPHGAPKLLLPLLVPIEVLSYCVRPVSLSIRLFVNMMAGHTMLKVFVTFIAPLGLLGVAPLALAVGLTMLEFAIAFLQAYVFTVLACIYLSDAVHMH